MDLPGPVEESSRVLRRQLFSYWIAVSLLLATGFGFLNLIGRQREVLADAEHARTLVKSALAAPMSSQERQALLLNFSKSDHEDHEDGVNWLVVVNETGHVLYASNPRWRDQLISDLSISQPSSHDPDLSNVVSCFRHRQGNCMELESNDLQLRATSFTVVRRVEVPRQDLGLRPQQLLLLVNYDPGILSLGYTQGLLGFLLLSLLTSGLLSLMLWSLLYSRFLPQLMETAQIDGLTQLMNRSLFMEQAKELLAEAEERKGDLVFAILDLDHFKRINDTFGHSCGDRALAHVAEILRTVTRPDDLVCRFGGEEFALLLNGSRESAGKALERLRLQLEMSRLKFSGHQLALQTSIGASATAECGYNIDYLYTTSDKALYAAKQGGRNRVAWSDGRIVSRLTL